MTNGALFDFARLLLAIQMVNMPAYIINLLLDCVKPTVHTLLKGIHIIFDEAVELEHLFIIHTNYYKKNRCINQGLARVIETYLLPCIE